MKITVLLLILNCMLFIFKYGKSDQVSMIHFSAVNTQNLEVGLGKTRSFTDINLIKNENRERSTSKLRFIYFDQSDKAGKAIILSASHNKNPTYPSIRIVLNSAEEAFIAKRIIESKTSADLYLDYINDGFYKNNMTTAYSDHIYINDKRDGNKKLITLAKLIKSYRNTFHLKAQLKKEYQENLNSNKI